MKILTVSAFVLALALGAPTSAFLPSVALAQEGAQEGQRAPKPDIAAARARVLAKWEEIKAEGFAGAVRIDLGEDIVIRAAAGLADPATGRPWTPDTQFEIGSLTKPMTAAGILKLQDQGKLSVNDPLSKFFPGIPAAIGAVTLHQLMVHTSGVPEFGLPVAANPDLEPLDRAGFQARIFATPLRFEPGKDFLYSNAGYSILAAVIEVVTREDYETWLKREVLVPGGARATGYRSVLDVANGARTTDGRDISTCCWGPGPLSWNLVGNGGIVSNLDDFISWRKAFAAGKVVSPAAARQAATAYTVGPEGGGEGYGWIIGQFPTRGQLEMAAGGNPHFTTEMRHYPEYGLTTLVTTNNRRMRPGEVSGRLVRAMFGEPDAPPSGPGPGVNLAEETLLDAFVAALADPDAAARRAFLVANAGPVFVQETGMEAIVGRFDTLARELAGAQAVGRENDGQGEVRLRFKLPAGGERTVVIQFGGSPAAPKLAGFEAE